MDATSIIRRLNSFSPEVLKADEVARREALGLSRMLTLALQDPVDAATEAAFSPLAAVALRIGVDLEIFKNVANGDHPVETKALADAAKSEEELVYRIARFAGSLGYLDEVSPGLWGPTPLTRAMSIETISAGHRFILNRTLSINYNPSFETVVLAGVKAPQYLREKNYRAPVVNTDGIAQLAFQNKLTMFEYVASKPHLQKDFNLFMGATMGARKYWTEWYPVAERVLNGAKPDTELLVDIAGGKGHDLQLFLDKFPNAKGLVLQELPSALQAATPDVLDPSVKRMEYNFFTEQPIKGARAYFLHHVIHDWPYGQALKILRRVHAAMEPGYSKLFLHELILPDDHPNAFQCTFDMAMLIVGGMERSRSQWKGLLKEAGFDAVQFWMDKDENADGIIEVERS